MGERDAGERFARALEQGATHSDDQEFDDELAVVAMLRQSDTSTQVDSQTRHNIAARIAEKTAEDTADDAPPPRPRTRRRIPRIGVAAAVLLLVGGLALLLSEQALPGDPLYPVKRARESAVLALTFDAQERALQRLSYAQDRVGELRQLADDGINPGAEATAYVTGLTDFEAATRAASSTLTRIGINSGGTQLSMLHSWAATRAHELGTLVDALPPATAQRQQQTVHLLQQVQQRIQALRQRFDCYRITAGRSDAIGPLPATGSCRAPGSSPEAPQPSQPQQRPPQTPPEQHRDDQPEHHKQQSDGPPVDSVPESTDEEAPLVLAKDSEQPAVSTDFRHEPLTFEQNQPAPPPEPPTRPRVPTDPAHPPDGVLNSLVNTLLKPPLG